MKKEKTRRQKAIIKRRIFLSICAVVVVCAIALIALVINTIIDVSNNADNASSSSSSVSSEPPEPYVVSTAKVLSIGDIMGHSPQLTGAYNPSTKRYDFSAYFKEMGDYLSSCDLSIANLEVTFGGKEAGAYKGYPTFNTPDDLADSIKEAGISTLLTANNHSYDTGLSGMKRTARVLEEKGIAYTGTRQTEDEAKYIVTEVNGIKIGIANFTYETTQSSSTDRKYLNGILLASEANTLVNSFSYHNIERFYTEAEEIISSMKNDGAEFISFYLHWGEEYQTTENTWQNTISQKLCNLGVNMIIGGHPHVVQPIKLLHSEDSENTAICVYSLGNAVSNQRREFLSACRTGHSEDGLIFTYTLEKYSDGKIVLSEVDAIPMWVNRYLGKNGYLYTIYPLESEDYGSQKYNFSGANLTDTKTSFERTKKIIAEGLTECQQYLDCDIRFKTEAENTNSAE